MVGECVWLERERRLFYESLIWRLNAWWNVEAVQKRKMGLSSLGGRALMVGMMDGMSGWQKVKFWLGGLGCREIQGGEWEILFRESAKFCRTIMDKRWDVAVKGFGSRTAARLVVK